MKSLKELREKEADRSTKRALVYSTSQGRANFAEALESAQVEKAIVGFDRYGRPVAALVPIEVIRMIAGYEDEVDEALRARLRKMARIFLEKLPEKATIAGYDEIDEAERPPPAPTRKKGGGRGAGKRG